MGIEFRNVSKNFGGTLVVDDLSLEIEDGEFIVLLGPSGCGKTTTLRKLDKAQRTERVKRVAAMLEIESLLERKPRQLSGGDRQRVAVARAIVREPRAYLMDEPLSNLDARLRVQMRGELKRLQHQLGTTTIYVTHDQAEAMTLASRVAVMRKGRLQQFDTPMNIYNQPANRFVAEFVGSPSMNFVEGRIDSATFVSDSLRVQLSADQIERIS